MIKNDQSSEGAGALAILEEESALLDLPGKAPKAAPTPMTLEDVEQVLSSLSPKYISRELCGAYVCYYLVKHGDAYPYGLIRKLNELYPMYRVSDSTLYTVCDALEAAGVIKAYLSVNPDKPRGPGRPCHFYTIEAVEDQSQANAIAALWQNYHTLLLQTFTQCEWGAPAPANGSKTRNADISHRKGTRKEAALVG